MGKSENPRKFTPNQSTLSAYHGPEVVSPCFLDNKQSLILFDDAPGNLAMLDAQHSVHFGFLMVRFPPKVGELPLSWARAGLRSFVPSRVRRR